MSLLNFTKTSGLIVLLFSSAIIFGQPFQTSKYNKEYNPYFKFNKFKRGINSDKIAVQLDVLDNKPKSNWTFDDSLEFAELSLLTQNFDLSQYYLECIAKSHILNDKTKRLLLIDCYLTENFEAGEKLIAKSFNNSSEFDKYLKDVFLARKNYLESGQVQEKIFDILPEDIDIEKGSNNFESQVILPLEKARDVIEFYVLHIHEDDPIIAKCFSEIGQVLEKHVSLNQAYIAYSIARIYDNHDKAILENVKRIKSKHVKKNYNTPKFRNYFPRIEYWRFDYEILKEKIIQEKNDTIPKFPPPLLAQKEDDSLPIPKDLLVPLGIFIILLLFLIFTRSKKQ